VLFTFSKNPPWSFRDRHYSRIIRQPHTPSCWTSTGT
jgi:hypothetical protein